MENISALRIAAVDDEPECREQAASLIESFGDAHGYAFEVKTFSNGESFLAAFRKQPFDIVFMDVYMEDMDGVACCEKLREADPARLIIFLTTSSEHMPEAFSCHAFDYVRKPPTRDRLWKVLSDAVRVVPVRPESIEIMSGRNRVALLMEDICSVVSDAHYLEIATADGRSFRSRMKMDAFFELVRNDPRFLRINKGIAVNADHVTGFGNGSCMLANGSYLPMRIRDRRHIEETIRNYRFDAIRAQQKRS